MHAFPQDIQHFFRRGGFSVSLSGRPWDSVALDEAHEMKINKECKTSIVRPSKDYTSRVAGYIPYRVRCLEHAREKLFPEEGVASHRPLPSAIVSTDSCDKKALTNVAAQVELIQSARHLSLRLNLLTVNHLHTKKLHHNKST